MSQRTKLLVSITNNSTNVRFEDLDKLLRSAGFECRQGDGSHCTYRKQGCPPLTVPKHKPVKAVYVKKAVAFIQEYGDLEEDS